MYHEITLFVIIYIYIYIIFSISFSQEEPIHDVYHLLRIRSFKTVDPNMKLSQVFSRSLICFAKNNAHKTTQFIVNMFMSKIYTKSRPAVKPYLKLFHPRGTFIFSINFHPPF